MHILQGTAAREDSWWIVEVEGPGAIRVGATQGRTQAEAQRMADDLAAAMLDVPVGDVRVEVDFLPSGDSSPA